MGSSQKRVVSPFPDTSDLSGCPEAVQPALTEQLAIVWADIGPDTLSALVDSMPTRVQALIDAKGWYTISQFHKLVENIEYIP